MNPSIPRHTQQDSPDSFKQLYRQGLAYLQQLSGQIWTDYNLHDPGVTILEQVCYALTDLVYRSDFTVADYLAQSDGQILYNKQGLALADDILRSRPQQATDFEAYLLKTIPELEAVWVTSQRSSPYQGINQIACRLNQFNRQRCLGEPGWGDQIIERIKTSYHQVRPLGNDLAKVHIVGETGVELHAEIEITAQADPSQLCAEIYAQTARWITRQAPAATLNGLSEILLAIPGVLAINHWQLVSYEQEHSRRESLDHLPEHAWLIFPLSASDMQLQLRQHEHPVSADYTEVQFYFQHHPYHDAPSLNPPVERAITPVGHAYNLSQYESIQTSFPRNYRLRGEPSRNDNRAQRSMRHQLRSYLLLFDQLMANFCGDLAGIRTLYSTSLTNTHSYQVQVLTPQQFEGIHQHYPQQPVDRLQQIQSCFDDYPQRKGRIFNYLLALYGEHYPDDFHRRFNCYHTPEQLEWQLLKYKQQFILQIASLTAERGSGPNLQQAHIPGGYIRRIALLLGMQPPERPIYSRSITQHLLNIVSNHHFEQSDIGQKTLFRLRKTLSSQLSDVPQYDHSQTLTDQQIRQMRSAIAALKGQTMPASLLQHGIDHHRYQILKRTKEGDYQLFFKYSDDDPQQLLYIGRHRQRQKLIQFSHYLQQWLIKLNQESEGIYVVEHITLRPEQNAVQTRTPDDPYSQQFSLVFPGFTARHHQSLFRRQARDIIERNSPAHLLIHYHWLSFYDFCRFETLYLDWRNARAHQQNQSDQAGVERQASKLFQFLQQPTNEDEELTL